MSKQVAIISGNVVVAVATIPLLGKLPSNVLVKSLPETHNVSAGDQYRFGTFIPSSESINFSHAISCLPLEERENVCSCVGSDEVKRKIYLQLCREETVSLGDSRLRDLFTPNQLFIIYESGKA